VGSYKQPLIQQIVHAAFDPLGVRQHFLAIVTSSFISINHGGEIKEQAYDYPAKRMRAEALK
jgi:hypothetical protein